MIASPDRLQRALQLAPLHEVFARVAAFATAVEPQELELTEAAGRVLAADLAVLERWPAQALSIRRRTSTSSSSRRKAGRYR